MSDDASGSYGPATATVASLVDPAFEASSEVPAPEAVVETLRENKFSREHLEGTDYPSTGADDDRRHREAREETRSTVTERLDAAGVRYVAMKELRGARVLMHDVDLLVPGIADEAAVIRCLEELDYTLYRFRLLAHPRKVMGRRSPDDQTPVDLYPAAMWIRKHVCDAQGVIQRSRDAGRREPTAEDDMYLVATHAYAHLDVTFAEMFHGVTVLEEATSFDWYHLLGTAARWGCQDALYAYLRLVDHHLEATGRERIPGDVLRRLEAAGINRVTRRWLPADDYRLDYPVDVPVWAGTLASSVHHVPRVARRLGVRETWKDLQTHGLSAASELLLGET